MMNLRRFTTFSSRGFDLLHTPLHDPGKRKITFRTWIFIRWRKHAPSHPLDGKAEGPNKKIYFFPLLYFVFQSASPKRVLFGQTRQFRSPVKPVKSSTCSVAAVEERDGETESKRLLWGKWVHLLGKFIWLLRPCHRPPMLIFSCIYLVFDLYYYYIYSALRFSFFYYSASSVGNVHASVASRSFKSSWICLVRKYLLMVSLDKNFAPWMLLTHNSAPHQQGKGWSISHSLEG